MSITVNNVTKTYGVQNALDDISFNIGKGEIVGFLGPNGAGKSTMMKIITCFIPPTAGSVTVCDHDIASESLDVRRKVGYLPENNPLYLDMYVKEYLRFIGGLHKIKNTKQRVADMINLVGLEVEQSKKIGALSKGYRQRVGLAQSLIHDPEVLILDEPTSGLDPIQLDEIRSLIKQVGKEKTVMLSTHIMQEVEILCDRVIIIKKGKIVADDTTSGIQKEVTKDFIVAVEFDKPVDLALLQSLSDVQDARAINETNYLISSKEGKDIRQDIFQFAVQQNLSVLSMQKEAQSLESAFKKLTQ